MTDPGAGWVLPIPGEAMADLWCLALDGHEEFAQDCSVLSAPERARASRFHFERDRRRWVAARAGLRAVLARYVELTPAAIEFEYGEHGKPQLRATDRDLSFSLSHCEGLAVIGVAGSGVIGVDVERVRPLADAPALVTRFFAREEQEAVLAGAYDLPARFFACWTRKEAVIKATGLGIGFGLDRFAVSVPPDDPPRVRWMARDPSGTASWRLAHVEPAPGFVGAIALGAPSGIPLSDGSVTVVARQPADGPPAATGGTPW